MKGMRRGAGVRMCGLPGVFRVLHLSWFEFALASVFLIAVWIAATLPFRVARAPEQLPVPIGDDPADVDVAQASVALKSKQLHRALALADRALRRQPGFVAAKLVKAQAFEKMGAPARAMELYKNVIDTEVENYEGQLGFGRLLALTSPQQALGRLKLAAEQSPRAAAPLVALGMLLTVHGSTELLPTAEDYFSEALRREPN